MYFELNQQIGFLFLISGHLSAAMERSRQVMANKKMGKQVLWSLEKWLLRKRAQFLTPSCYVVACVGNLLPTANLPSLPRRLVIIKMEGLKHVTALIGLIKYDNVTLSHWRLI